MSTPSSPTERPVGPPTRRNVLLAGVAVAVLGLGLLVWFLGGDAPAAVDIEDASDAVSADPSAAADTTTPAGVEGTWMVDTSVGEFSVEETTGTFVGFRIQEELANVGAAEAVGRTPDVTGSATIDAGELTSAEFTADMTAIRSDRSRRDSRIQDALATTAHPTATFVLDSPVAVGALAGGGVVSLDAPGTITIAGVAREVVVPLRAVVEGGTIVVAGSFEVVFADHGVEVPSAPMVLSVEERGVVEIQLYLTRA